MVVKPRQLIQFPLHSIQDGKSSLNCKSPVNIYPEYFSEVSSDSVVVIQIFDQKRFVLTKDQGFLGLIHIDLGQVIELQSEFEESKFYWFTYCNSSN